MSGGKEYMKTFDTVINKDASGRFLFDLDKTLQKSIGYNGNAMMAHVTMSAEKPDMQQEDIREPVTAACQMDALTAIKTRQSIRRFTS